MNGPTERHPRSRPPSRTPDPPSTQIATGISSNQLLIPMNGIFVVVRKEILDTLRDRRTLMAMVLLPLCIFPLFIIGGSYVAQSQVEKAAGETLDVAVVGETTGRFLGQVSVASNIEVVEGLPMDTVRARIDRGDLDAAVVFESSFPDRIAANRPGRVDLLYHSDDDSGIMLRRLRPILDRFEDQLLAARFEALGLSTDAARAIQVNEVNLASEQAQTAQQIGGYVPYMFILFCFMGAMYPALDMGAGEKERGTLETLLTTPVSRLQFLVGKTLVITLSGLFAAITSIASLVGSVWFIPDLPASVLDTATSIVSPTVVSVLLSLLVPLTIFFGAAQLSLSFYARSYKEAQSTVSPLLFVVIFPAFLGLLPGISLNVTTALVPVLNIALATKEVLGGTLEPGLYVLVFASLLTLAGISLLVSTVMLRSERVLFRL